MTNETPQNRKPAFKLFIVNGENDAARWTQVGAAWSHRDNHGYTVVLDAIPLTGRLVMRAATENTEANGGQQ